MRVWCLLPWLCALAGCGGATVTARELDAQSAPTDASGRDAAADAPRCDPSVLSDAGTGAEDAGAPTDAAFVVELSLNSILHQCARMSDGTVRCRGANHFGELGRGFNEAGIFDPPQTVPGLVDVEQVLVIDPYATCTRHRDGSVRCWGSNEYGQLGTGHEGDETCDSVLGPVGCRTRPTLVPGLTDVVHLATNLFQACAVRRDGAVWCWGRFGVLLPMGGSATPHRTSLENVVGLWPRGRGWVARLRSGEHINVQTNPAFQVPAGAVIEGHQSSSHLCYRMPDTSIRCVGRNADGKIGNGTSSYPEDVETPWDPGLCGVRSVITGSYHTCALLSDRSVSCWGDPFGSTSLDPDRARCVGLRGPTSCETTPTPLPGLDHVAQIFPATWGGCALRLDHTVFCWGIVNYRANPRVPSQMLW